jgi:hypothetical protein
MSRWRSAVPEQGGRRLGLVGEGSQLLDFQRVRRVPATEARNLVLEGR